MPDLKPCPFCGGEALLDTWWEPADRPVVYVVKIFCLPCNVEMTTECDEEAAATQIAIAAWNRRVGNCALESHPRRGDAV